MYNEDIKNEFLKKAEEEGKTYLIKTKYMFYKVEPYEEAWKKDVALFTKDEISTLYIDLEILLGSLYVVHSFLRAYAVFYSEKYKVDCPILNMSQEEVKRAYGKREIKIEKNNFPVKIFIDKIDALKNPADKFIIYGLFNGVRGLSNCELAFSTMEDCDREKRLIWLADTDGENINLKGRLYQADEKLFEYALKASETYEYYTYEVGREQKIKLISNRMFKVRNNDANTINETIATGKSKVNNRIKILLKQMNLDDFTTVDIYKIGLAYHVKKICLEYGVTEISEIFETEDYKKIKEQYGLTNSNRNIQRMLRGYL